MKITTKGRYGLRAMVDLAVFGEQGPVSTHSIGERQGISDGYLEQLIGKLKRAGLVEGVRGAAGGYRLARPAAEISVGDILRALEGSLYPVDCPGLGEGAPCENEGSCVAKGVWKKIGESIEAAVDGISLEALREESQGRQSGPEAKQQTGPKAGSS